MPLPFGVVGAALALLGGGSAATYGLVRFRPESVAALYGYDIEKTVGQYAAEGAGQVNRAFASANTSTPDNDSINFIKGVLNNDNCKNDVVPHLLSVYNEANLPNYITSYVDDKQCAKTVLEAYKTYMLAQYKRLTQFSKYFYKGSGDLTTDVLMWKRDDADVKDTGELRNLPLVLSGGMTFNSDTMETAKALYTKDAHSAIISWHEYISAMLGQCETALNKLKETGSVPNVETKAEPKAEPKAEVRTNPAAKPEQRAEADKAPAQANVRPKADVVAKPKPKKKGCAPQDMGKPGCPVIIDL